MAKTLSPFKRTLYIRQRIYSLAVPDRNAKRCISINSTIQTNASKLRQNHRFSYWDSLIVASALKAQAEIIYSEDMQHGLVVDKILTIINPLRA